MYQYHTCAFQYPLCPDFCRPDVCVNSTWLVCPDMGMFGLVRAMLGWISVGRSLAHGWSKVRIVGHLGDLGWIFMVSCESTLVSSPLYLLGVGVGSPRMPSLLSYSCPILLLQFSPTVYRVTPLLASGRWPNKIQEPRMMCVPDKAS